MCLRNAEKERRSSKTRRKVGDAAHGGRSRCRFFFAPGGNARRFGGGGGFALLDALEDAQQGRVGVVALRCCGGARGGVQNGRRTLDRAPVARPIGGDAWGGKEARRAAVRWRARCVVVLRCCVRAGALRRRRGGGAGGGFCERICGGGSARGSRMPSGRRVPARTARVRGSGRARRGQGADCAQAPRARAPRFLWGAVAVAAATRCCCVIAAARRAPPPSSARLCGSAGGRRVVE